MCHLFIHTSIYEHLDGFQILAIVNNATMDIKMHISFQISVLDFLDKYTEVELLGPTVVLFLIFLRTSRLFSILTTPIYNTTNSAQGFPFLHILAITCCLLIY